MSHDLFATNMLLDIALKSLLMLAVTAFGRLCPAKPLDGDYPPLVGLGFLRVPGDPRHCFNRSDLDGVNFTKLVAFVRNKNCSSPCQERTARCCQSQPTNCQTCQFREPCQMSRQYRKLCRQNLYQP